MPDQPDTLVQMLREHYLELLEDQSDSQDPAMIARIAKAAQHEQDQDRICFRQWLSQREG